MNSREHFVRHIGSEGKAIEAEAACLSIGRSLLPDCARAVLDGGEGTYEYWDWLIGQTEEGE